jgi:lipopolysaccharide biosynthesis glycosyltransferase
MSGIYRKTRSARNICSGPGIKKLIDMIINIALAADDRFLQALRTALFSIFRHAAPDDRFRFSIICDRKALSEKSRQIIEQDIIRNGRDKASLSFLYIEDSYYELPECFAGSYASYYRYALGRLIPDTDKVLYLDSDIIVLSSLAPLFGTDLRDNFFAGVEDLGYRFCRYFIDPVKYFCSGEYFNCGVILFNLKLMRSENIEQKLIDFTKNEKRIVFSDQDALNTICEKKLKLDYIWNTKQESSIRNEPVFTHPEMADILKAARTPRIIHYITSSKPWLSPFCRRGNIWHRHYLELVLHEDISRFTIKIILYYCIQLLIITYFTLTEKIHLFLKNKGIIKNIYKSKI